MSNFPGYKTKAFSPSQKFFVLDPNTGSPSFVQGSDLVAQLTPNSNYVYSESTRTTAQATDYAVGSLVQTAGSTTAGDNFAAVYLVVDAGEGDFPMDNGNELLVIAGDELLREQLASSDAGDGSDLVMHTGTTETVTETLDQHTSDINQRTIYVGSVAELEALPTPIEDQEALVKGVPFRYDGSNWNPSKGFITPQCFEAEADGVADDTSSIQDAIDYMHSKGGGEVFFPPGEYCYSETMFNMGNVALIGCEGFKAVIKPLPGMNDVLGEGLFSTFIAAGALTDPTTQTYLKTTIDISGKKGPHENIRIEGLKIYGTRPSVNAGQRIAPNVRVLEAFETTGWFVEDNWVIYSEDGAIRPNSAGEGQSGDFGANLDGLIANDYGEIYDVVIRNNRITEGYFGIETIQFPKNFWIQDNWIENPWLHGLRIHGGRDGEVSGNHVTAEEGYAAGDALYIDRCYRVSFFDNWLYSRRDNGTASSDKERVVRLQDYREISIHHNHMVRGAVMSTSTASQIKDGLQLYDNYYHDEGGQFADTFDLSGVTYDHALIPAITFRNPAAILSNTFVREVVPTNADKTEFARYTQDSGLPDVVENANGQAVLDSNGGLTCYRKETYANNSSGLEFDFPAQFLDVDEVISGISGADFTADAARLEAAAMQVVVTGTSQGQKWVQRCSSNFTGTGANNVFASMWAKGEWRYLEDYV